MSRAQRELRWFKPSEWQNFNTLPSFHAGYTDRDRKFKQRCPECNGELIQWAAFHTVYKIITFRCSSGHFVQFNHGMAFRAATLEEVYELYKESNSEKSKRD